MQDHGDATLMPSRIIREGWLESEFINQLDAPGERFFLRLCLRADDFGRYHANPVLLRSNLFPLCEGVRSADIPRWLAACEKAGLVRCYQAEAKAFLEIVKFGQRIREGSVSKFPSPQFAAVGGNPPQPAAERGGSQPMSETKAEAYVEGVGGDEKGGGNPPPLLPLLLNVPGFVEPWQQWQAIRKKGKKPKTSWEEYFAKQLAWLEQFGLQSATEIVATSARNEWGGLFEPKGVNGKNHQRKGEFDNAW